ncbi:spectinomycin phosphotransferase [Reticulibacter mediterranei]|uniref:Spectinomycin phosphotransferase n=1 Tax=Reticulibacter mediterranei TaxID=2778369 RepID=A0A8J3IXG5_9CHLR|nr:phosphotransferase [Reticulibacter mediterranei]GHO99694.1 spectinomycin phosphotransferase [Reticulibacter mediterranei]
MREKPNIAEEQLLTHLEEEYHLSVLNLEFLPLGLDTNAGTYRVVTGQGTAYFLKAKQVTSFYEPTCIVPRYLCDQGIAAVVAPIPTQQQTLWTQFGNWRIMLYPFIDGETSWQPGLNDEQWHAVGAAFKRIHEATLPPEGFPSLRIERFDPGEYSRWIESFEALQLASHDGSSVERDLRACWIEHQSTIHTLLSLMEKLARSLTTHTGPRVICHADLHPGNILRTPSNDVFVIDWDDVMLAPKERDFLFVNTNGSPGQTPSPFFQGYGTSEIDWAALTYYRSERVITDLIACAQDVLFRDDLEEATKAEAVELFRDIFGENGEVEMAFATALYLEGE